MDKDELKKVFDLGMMTEDDYRRTYETANKIILDYQKHKKEYYKFVSYYFNKLFNQ